MHQSIRNGIAALLLMVALTGCDQEASLQSYYVDNQEMPNFISLDIPLSMLNLEEVELTEEQKEAYESIDKLNMLAFSADAENQEEYKAELDMVNDILKDERYEDLMRGGNSKDGRFVIKYIGTDTTIDELIILGNSNDRGFAIIRVLGNKMDPVKIMKLGDVVSKLNSDEEVINQFRDFFEVGNPSIKIDPVPEAVEEGEPESTD